MKIERQRGYHIGFGNGQDDQKAKLKRNSTPVAASSDAQALADTSKTKNPENDMIRICTATSMSSTVNNASSTLQQLLSTYNDDKVQ